MNYFFDTSALIKAYIKEDGSNNVDKILDESSNIYVSDIALIESFSVLRRLCFEKKIQEKDYVIIKKEILTDFNYFSLVQINENIKDACLKILEVIQLKSLDTIHLASALILDGKFEAFVSCDNNLLKAAKKFKLKTINPSEK